MNNFIKGYFGDFIYINCNVFPITSYMYSNSKVFKQEDVYDLEEYVVKLIDKLNLGNENLYIFKKYSSCVEELIMNEKGIVKLSIKEKKDAS
jgi:hypothetical protein